MLTPIAVLLKDLVAALEGDVTHKVYTEPISKPPRRKPSVTNKSNREDYMKEYMTKYRKEDGKDYFHWYLTIVPRISQPAGFEVGTGIFINSSVPEESAEFLRQVKATPSLRGAEGDEAI